MKERSPYGPRIKSARKKLRKSVNAFAAELGVSRQTQLNYEGGITVPTIAYLDGCLRAGACASDLLLEFKKPDAKYKILDISASDIPVQLHATLERHRGALSGGGGTTELYNDLWQMFRSVIQKN